MKWRSRHKSKNKTVKKARLDYGNCEPRHLMAADVGLNFVPFSDAIIQQRAQNHLADSGEFSKRAETGFGLEIAGFNHEQAGSTTLFQQTYAGRPVYGNYIAIEQDQFSSSPIIHDYAVQQLNTNKSATPVNLQQAIDIAESSLADSNATQVSVEQVWFMAGESARLAWRIDTVSSTASENQPISTLVDASNGSILSQEDPSTWLNQLLSNPENQTGIYPRIAINDNIGASGSRDYAAPFDSVVSLDLGCTGTLIASDVVLSARHCGAGSGDTITFGDNSNNGVYTATIQSVTLPDGNGSLLDGGDVSILKLTQPVPSNIASPMRLVDATSSLEGRVAATIGYGYNGLGSTGHGFTADGWRWGGENTIDVYGSPSSANGSNIFSTDFDNGSNAANTIGSSSSTPLNFEATTAPGDSGGPLLVQVNNEWVIAGVLSGGTTNDSRYGDISWWTGTSVYRSQIEAAGGQFVDDNGNGSGQLGTVSFDQANYRIGDSIGVQVTDRTPGSSVQVTLQSSSGDQETLTLAPGSQSTYSSAITTAEGQTGNNDGILQVVVGDTITVTYEDPDDGNGGSGTVSDTAGIAQTSSATTLVGVDFDESSGNSPTQWLKVGTGSNATFENLTDQSGNSTDIDLTIVDGGDGAWDEFFATPTASTIPQSAESLSPVDGQIYSSGDSLTLTYSDLSPGTRYEIYLFAAESFFSSISQQVTIQGADSPISFEQNFAADELFVNDQLGSNQREISEYAQFMTADANGEIVINVDPINGTDDVVLAGVAIAKAETTSAQSIGEVGNIARVNHVWQTVTLNRTYQNPVIVMGPHSTNGGDPAHMRIRNVTQDSFEVRVQEFDYLDGKHTFESVGYMVMEAGSHELADGTVVVAGSTTLTNGRWQSVDLAGFDTAPVVVSHVMSDNESDSVITRQRGVNSNGFQIRMQEQESSDQRHANETVGWIAITQIASGNNEGTAYEVGLTGDSVTHRNNTLNYQNSFVDAPVLIASMQTSDGGDTANLRTKSNNAERAVIYVDEEQSQNREVRHTTEKVGYFAFQVGDITGTNRSGRSALPTETPSTTGDLANHFLAMDASTHEDLSAASKSLQTSPVATPHDSSMATSTHLENFDSWFGGHFADDNDIEMNCEEDVDGLVDFVNLDELFVS